MPEGGNFTTHKCEQYGDLRRRNLRTLFFALIPPVALGIAVGVLGYHIEPNAMGALIGASGGTAAGLAVDVVASCF